MKRLKIFAVSGVLLFQSFAGNSQAEPTAAPRPAPSNMLSVSLEPIRGGAYWARGGISNSGVIVGDKGVIVIDSQMLIPGAKNLLAEIAKVTPKPVNEMILTHSDPDHINALPAYPAGLEIIAQANTKRDIDKVVADPHSNGSPPPPEIKTYVPTRVVESRDEVTLDGVRLVLMHVAPAHTDGDLIVYLPAQMIVYAGDLLTPAVGAYPGIHLNKHGSFRGWAKSVRAMLALNADIFVSGHGEPLSRTELQSRLTNGEVRFSQIAALVAQHKTLDEVKAALGDAPPTGIAARFPTFTETTYKELTDAAGATH